MILFFDTETTGFPSGKREPNDPKQARLVQLAAQLVTPENRTVMEFSLIINPLVPIPEEASNIHGITNDIAEEYGVSEPTAVDFFLHLSEFASLHVAHNEAFDRKVMENALARRNERALEPIQKPTHCTMQQARNMGMPKAGLAFLMQHLFDEDHAQAHDAMADTIACRRVYFKLNPLESTA